MAMVSAAIQLAHERTQLLAQVERLKAALAEQDREIEQLRLALERALRYVPTALFGQDGPNPDWLLIHRALAPYENENEKENHVQPTPIENLSAG